MSFSVTIEDFDGPVGLLLSLITSSKMDLFAVSIVDLVSCYLAELDRLEVLDLEVATEFYVVAATLIDLKCKRLLPKSERDEPEDDYALSEERELLLIRLLENQLYRNVSVVLADMAVQGAKSLARRVGPEPEILKRVSDPLKGITINQLVDSYKAILGAKEKEYVDSSHITVHAVDVNSVTTRFFHRLSTKERTSFAELVSFASSRLEVVVCFLSLLEAYRLGAIELFQDLDSDHSISISHIVGNDKVLEALLGTLS